MASIEKGHGIGASLTRILGVVIGLIGLTLVIGGAQLMMIGGSAYYLVTGILMVLSGLLMVMLRLSGALLYTLVVLGTILWAVWEVGLNGWALVPRVIAPMVLLFFVILSMGALKRDGGGRLVLMGLAGWVLVLLVGGGVVVANNRAGVMNPVPSAG